MSPNLALASHPEVSLPGSNFEIDTDANLKVDDAGSLDWMNVAQTNKADKPSGATDDSFGNGTKEDTPVPSVIDGSIPPNKSDLTNFGVYLETTATGARFLNLYWTRVQEPSGTTNMDFEFNQSKVLSANGVTPVRTAGDLLIQYDLSQGGTNPQLFVSRWVTTGAGSLCQANNATPCWGTRTNLTAAGDATGSINTSAIPNADDDGLSTTGFSPRTFGEAQLDFDALTGGLGACVSFGSAYLKSRSSDSFTAAVKDFIAPASLNLNKCGGIVIRKVTVPSPDPTDTSFAFTLTGGPSALNASFSLKNGESNSTAGANVLAGSGYNAAETVPANWTLTSATCDDGSPVANIDVSVGETVTCTFTNTRQTGAIKITKTRKHAADGSGNHPHAGVSFTVNGVTKVTDSNGVACFDGLNLATYSVHEILPTGYHGEADKNVTVDNGASCSDTTYVGETVSFHNTPLTDLTVSVNSQVDGGTGSTIDCDPVAPGVDKTVPATAPDNGDGSYTKANLEPGTYTCTIVIDP